LRAAGEIGISVQSVEVGDDANPRQKFPFQRTFPAIQTGAVSIVVEVESDKTQQNTKKDSDVMIVLLNTTTSSFE